jgi:hypothetical protein
LGSEMFFVYPQLANGAKQHWPKSKTVISGPLKALAVIVNGAIAKKKVPLLQVLALFVGDY